MVFRLKYEIFYVWVQNLISTIRIFPCSYHLEIINHSNLGMEREHVQSIIGSLFL